MFSASLIYLWSAPVATRSIWMNKWEKEKEGPDWRWMDWRLNTFLLYYKQLIVWIVIPTFAAVITAVIFQNDLVAAAIMGFFGTGASQGILSRL
jgi:hypothetical protein